MPFQHPAWYVVIEEPGQVITQIGPFYIKANEKKQIDIACVEAGSASGRVLDPPTSWHGQLWVIAFSNKSIRAAALARADGSFAFEDADVPQFVSREDVRTKIIDPFQRAVKVTIESGRKVEDIELALPPR